MSCADQVGTTYFHVCSFDLGQYDDHVIYTMLLVASIKHVTTYLCQWRPKGNDIHDNAANYKVIFTIGDLPTKLLVAHCFLLNNVILM